MLDELKTILVERLKFDPRRAAEMTRRPPLPKGVDGSLGLDSLDFIELSVAIEERFGIVIDEREDLTAALPLLRRAVALHRGTARRRMRRASSSADSAS